MLTVSALISCVLAGPAWDENSKHIAAPYAVAHDTPLEAEEEAVAETEDYTQWRVVFNGIRGDRVPGFLYVPKGEARTHPAVLLQYGSGGNKKTNYIVALGQRFVARGFVVLTIDAPQKGERKSKDSKSVDWLFSLEGRDQFLQYCGDYSRAVDYLTTRPDVDPKRIGYVGISWGAITGVTYVAHDDRIQAMASIVGGGGFLGLAGSLAGRSDDRPAASKVPIDPVHHVGSIAPRPLLMLNVTKDQLVPRPFAEALHRAAGKGSKVVWIETDHLFRGVDLQDLSDIVIDFLKQNMEAPRSADHPGMGSEANG